MQIICICPFQLTKNMKRTLFLLTGAFSWSSLSSGQDFFESLPEDFLTPSVHITATYGVSSTEVGSLGTHGHDPNRDVTLQGAEVGLSLNANDYLKGFININAFTDEEGELDAEWEEGFLKLQNLPLGFEIRGGRYFNRFGLQNNVHVHGWDYVDSNLITTRFLGDEGLLSEGGELSWRLPVDFTSVISASFGRVPADEHGEEEEEEEGLEGESALFDEAFTVRWLNRFGPNDFHQHQIGLNFATGENLFGEDTNIYGADYVYTWRENGLEPGGRSLSVSTEFIYRDIDFADEESGLSGNVNEFGAAVSAIYGFNDDWSLGARYDYVEGLGDGFHEAEERSRYSLALTRSFQLPNDMYGSTRLQYNLDDVEDQELEHTVFFQINLSWGGPEVR